MSNISTRPLTLRLVGCRTVKAQRRTFSCTRDLHHEDTSKGDEDVPGRKAHYAKTLDLGDQNPNITRKHYAPATDWRRPRSDTFARQHSQPPQKSSFAQRSPSPSPLWPRNMQHPSKQPNAPIPLHEREEGTPLTVDEVQPKVQLFVDGQPHSFSAILLRDLCRCPQCVDPSTKQKARPSTDIPTAIEARAITQTKDAAHILWDNDASGYDRNHTTELSNDILRNYINGGATGIEATSFGRPTAWDAESFATLPDMTYNEYMESDSALYTALRRLHTHGLLFLSNVPESADSVSTIAERIGPLKNTFYGYTWDVRSVPDAKNVAYTSQDLGFHMDLLYLEQPPHLQFLHCIRSSSAGGASLFTDSYKSVRDLAREDMDAFKKLMTQRVGFHYDHAPSHLYFQNHHVINLDPNKWVGNKDALTKMWKDAVQKPDKAHPALPDVLDVIEGVSWSPPFQAPFGRRVASNAFRPHEWVDIVNKKVSAWHQAAQQFNRLIHRPEVVYERMMKPGECVLFDNRRVLHARKAFEVADMGKERWLRGAYLDKDPFHSKLRVLQRQFDEGTLADQPGSTVLSVDERDEDYFEASAAAS